MAKKKYKSLASAVLLRYRRAFTLCESLGVLPYRWNHETGVPEVDDSKKRLRLLHGAGALQIPLFTFSVFRFFQVIMSPDWLWTHKVYMIIVMGPHMFVLFFLLCAMVDRDDVVACSRHVISILKQSGKSTLSMCRELFFNNSLVIVK